MQISEHTLSQLYSHLGQLFYAIAKVDDVIRKEEENVLREIVSREWLPLENSEDEFHTDTAFQIEFMFDTLKESTAGAEETFAAFEQFYTDFPQAFSPKIKTLIVRTSRAIADSFSGTNQKEAAMLKELEYLMHKKK